MAGPVAGPSFDPSVLETAGFPVISFDRLEVGEEFRSGERQVQPDDVETFAFAIGDHDPWFFGPSPFGGGRGGRGGPIAPPTLLANQALFLRHSRYVVPAGLHARMIFRFVAPIPLGTWAQTTGRVVDKYWRRNKPYMVTDFETRGTDGSLLVDGRFVQMLFADATAPSPGTGDSPRPDPGQARLDPAVTSVRGREGVVLAVGHELPPLTRTITQAQIDCYSGVKPGSIHTDPEWAQAKGFPTTIAQGMMSTGYVSAVVVGALGDGFVVGGQMDARFLRPVCCGDTLTVTGTVTGFSRDDHDDGGSRGVRAHTEFVARNQRGEQTLAATASGLVTV